MSPLLIRIVKSRRNNYFYCAIITFHFCNHLKIFFATLDTCAAWTTCRKTSTQSSNSNQNDCYEDEIKEKILAASLPFVVELGWSRNALGAGAQAVGYPGVTHGLFPRGGADLVLYFQRSSNLKLVKILKEVISRINIHLIPYSRNILQLESKQHDSPIPPAQFVEKALQSRLKMIIPYLSRWPQAIAIMSLPPNVPSALATILTTVDDICYYAGDRSVDVIIIIFKKINELLTPICLSLTGMRED